MKYVSLWLGTLLFAVSVQGQVCLKWKPPEVVGELDISILSEASGLAVSRNFPNRFYHNNDSGDGPFFYLTEPNGSNTQKIEIADFVPVDLEEIALGPCLAGETCLFLADIGDNMGQKPVRAQVEIVILKEQKSYVQPVTPLNKLSVTFPDRPHNAEAMFIHPNGDLFVFTKESDIDNRRAEVAKIFKIPRSKLMSKDPVVFELVAELDIPWINYDFGLFGQILTGASVSEDGKKFILLTYENAIEFNLDVSALKNLASRSLVEDKDYHIIYLREFSPQQEAISYLPNSKSFIFSTEAAMTNRAPMFRMVCDE